MQFKIEKGVNIPPISRTTSKTYPFDKLEVDDSFLIPCQKEDAQKKQIAVLQAGSRYAKKYNVELKLRTLFVGDGVRVWRVSSDETN